MSDELKTHPRIGLIFPLKNHGRLIFDSRPESVAECDFTEEAAAIVHRVNCHDKLVEALERAQMWISASGHGDNCYVDDEMRCVCGLPKIEQEIGAALELAKGGTHD